MAAPQPTDQDQPLTPFETAVVIACFVYGIAAAVGIVWLIIQAARWLLEVTA